MATKIKIISYDSANEAAILLAGATLLDDGICLLDTRYDYGVLGLADATLTRLSVGVLDAENACYEPPMALDTDGVATTVPIILDTDGVAHGSGIIDVDGAYYESGNLSEDAIYTPSPLVIGAWPGDSVAVGPLPVGESSLGPLPVL